LKGHVVRAKELRDDAEKFLPAVLSLYKSGDGVWYGLHKDGQRVELRHLRRLHLCSAMRSPAT